MHEEWLEQQKRKRIETQIKEFVDRFARASGNDEEWQDVKRDYENSEIWKDLREKALKRAHDQCERCRGSTNVVGPLQVHHNTYERIGGREKMTDLEALCFKCHREAHRERDQIHADEREENYWDARLEGAINWFATRILKLDEGWEYDPDQEERVIDEFIKLSAKKYLKSDVGEYDKAEFHRGIPEWFKDQVMAGEHLDLIFDRDNEF